VTATTDFSALKLAVGHATDEAGATGLTVIRGTDYPLRAGAARFGRATGSRELLTASPDHLVGGRIDAILLTGGSAYGLDATAGVMDWMEDNGRGFPVGPGVVPIVPAAVVFDLVPVGRFDARPTRAMAFNACESATAHVSEGCVGAGTGVTVGKVLGPRHCMKSGFGCSIVSTTDGEVTVGAMAVVNAFGDVRDAQNRIIAGARDEQGAFVDTMRVMQGETAPPATFDELAMQNTTLVVVASSAPLSAVEVRQLAYAAGAGLYRRITPVGTSFDGDVVFAVSPTQGERSRIEPIIIESLAVTAVEQAIERAVRLARGRDGIPGLADANG
jgi:L-aminopeptidase/D-esterase-like protein